MLISSGLSEATLKEAVSLKATLCQLPPAPPSLCALGGPPPCPSAPRFQIWDPFYLRKLDLNLPVWWRLTISHPFRESPSESLIIFHCTTNFNINWNKEKILPPSHNLQQRTLVSFPFSSSSIRTHTQSLQFNFCAFKFVNDYFTLFPSVLYNYPSDGCLRAHQGDAW